MSKSKRNRSIQKGTVVKLCVGVLIAAVVVTGSVMLLRKTVRERYASDDKSEVQSAQVTTGSISTTVNSSGTLANQESEDTEIPGEVELNELYVEAGQTVESGDMLASVNSESVVSAMKSVQAQIDAVDENLDELDEDEVDEELESGVDGRVKKIYAEAGNSVNQVMYRHSALMLLSLDGKMSVELKTDKLSVGDSVSVATASGGTYEGSVESVWSDTATVLLTDNGPKYGEKVTVRKDGKKIGSGTLAIHEELAVTGYSGTIKAVKVTENQKISSGAVLLTLSDTSTEVNYATLLQEREAYEETLLDLIRIYKEGAVYAQKTGLITAITETEDGTSTTTALSSNSMQGSSVSTTTASSDADDSTVISICPTDEMTLSLSVDETDILALSVGQEAEVTIDSLGEETFTGTLTEIDTVGSSSDGVTTYSATVTMDKVSGMLEGMSASAVIAIEGKENALLVPADAVHKTSTASFVYTTCDEETGELGGQTEVVTGLSDGTNTEITEGLSEGDTVYYTEKEEESNPFNAMPGFSGGGMSGGLSGGGPNGMPGNRSGSKSGRG